MKISRVLPPLLAFILVTVALELAAAFGKLNTALIPPPHQMWNAWLEQKQDFVTAFVQSGRATLLGYFGAIVGGTGLAILFSLNVWLRRAVLPFAIFFQTVPIIAVAPLMVIYFGYGLSTVAAASFIVSVFPVLANTLLGLESTDPGELELFQVYGASRMQTLFRLRLPAAYPSIYAGLKVAAGLSVIGTVVGEFVAGGGLGAIIDTARTQQRVDLVFVALLLLSLLGLLLIGCVQVFHRVLNAYRPYGLHMKDI